MSNKIILGTVQFGLDYGVSNRKGIPSNNELNEIFSIAKVSGISLLDTAPSYGNAEKRIGDFSHENFKIITKINNIDSAETLQNSINNSLNNLKSNFLYGCLFHNVNEIFQNLYLWEELNNFKKLGLIKKIGVSLYHPKDLENLLLLKITPDIIQIPFNIIDRRFESYFERLIKLNVEIHVRSIFLQGLLINFDLMSNSKFSKWDSHWNKYKNWLKSQQISPLEAAISHVNAFKEISYCVIGVEDSLQLKQIILASKNKALKAPKSLISFDDKLINPYLW